MLSKKPKIRGAVYKADEERKKAGFYSLLMMSIGLILLVLLGVFLYSSPLFHEKSVALNKAVDVVPLPNHDAETVQDFQFYEILPKQQFPTPVEDRPPLPAPTEPIVVDVVVDDVAQDNAPLAESDLAADVMAENHSVQAVEGGAQIQQMPVPIDDTLRVGKSYVLQVHSYGKADLADQKRAEVMMAGVDAKVLKRQSSEGVIYQVVSTPMYSIDEVTAAYNVLQNSGIDSVVVEQNYRHQ